MQIVATYIAIPAIASYQADSTDHAPGIEWDYNKLYAIQGKSSGIARLPSLTDWAIFKCV